MQLVYWTDWNFVTVRIFGETKGFVISEKAVNEWYDIYLAAIGLTPGGSGTAHIYTQQYTEYNERNIHNNHKTEHA